MGARGATYVACLVTAVVGSVVVADVADVVEAAACVPLPTQPCLEPLSGDTPFVAEGEAATVRIRSVPDSEVDQTFIVRVREGEPPIPGVDDSHGFADIPVDLPADDMSVTITRNSSETIVAIPTLDDAEAEEDEHFWVMLLRPNETHVSSLAVWIVDDDAVQGVSSLSSPSAFPENGLPIEVPFINSTDQALDVWVVPNAASTATEGSDYTVTRTHLELNGLGVEQTQIILVGGDQTSKDAEPGPGDGIAEPPETIVLDVYAMPLNLAGGTAEFAPTVAGIARPIMLTLTLEIHDAATGGGQFVGTDVVVDESSGAAVFTVRRSGDLSDTVTIPIAVTGDTATAGTDYTTELVPPALEFAPFVDEVGVTLPLVDDQRYEGDEQFRIHLSQPTNGLVNIEDYTVTIVDIGDIPTPTLIPGPSVFVDESVGTVSFFLAVPFAPDVPLSFFVETVDGAATAGSDYTAFGQFVTIPSEHSTSALFQVTVVDNDAPEDAISESREEAFAVTVRSFDGTDVADATLVTVFDGGSAPRARFTQRPESEPNAPVTLRLVEGSTQPVITQLPVRLHDPDAATYVANVVVTGVELTDIDRVASDVTVTPSTLTFPPGTTEHTITVEIAANTSVEPDLEFIVSLEAEPRITISGAVDDAATIIVRDDDAPPPPTVADDVRETIVDWFPRLVQFGPIFDLSEIDWPSLELPEISPPVIPDLDDVFDLDELFRGLAPPQFDVDADALDDLVADMEEAGCPVEFAVGGAGGAPVAAPGDLIQVRCTRTLGQILEASGYTGSDLGGGTPEVLRGLATQLGLDADIDWRADGVVTIVAGADLEGVYVLGESGVRLGVEGTGDVQGQGTVIGVQNTAVNGQAQAALTVGVQMAADGTRRLRVSEIDGIVPERLVPVLDGEAAMTLTAAVDDTTLTWTGSWDVVHDDDGRSSVTTAHQLHLVQELPGFAVGGVPVPTTIDVVGTLTERNGVVGWDLVGTATPADGLELGGFTVTHLTLGGFVSTVGSDITVGVGLRLGDGDDAIDVDLAIALWEGGWTGQALVFTDVLKVGPFELEDVTLLVDAIHTIGAVPETHVSASVSAAGGRLVGDGNTVVAELLGVDGSITGSGELEIIVGGFDASIGGALDLFLFGVALSTPGPDGVVLEVASASATVPELGGVGVDITDLVVHADGRFSAASVSVSQPAGFARSIGLAGLVPVDLTGLRLDFTAVGPGGEVLDLSQFVITVDGTVDLSGFAALPFDPVVQLGGDVITPDSPAAERAISFSAFVQSVDPLVVTPLDLGPIGIGLRDLTVGEVVIDAQITAAGFVGGVLQEQLGGSASITGGFGTIEGSLSADLSGEFVDGATGTEVSATARIGFDAAQRNGVSIDDLAATLELRLGVDDGAPFLDADLTEVSVANVTIPFGEFATASLGDATLDLTPGAGGVVFAVGGDLGDETGGAALVFDTGIAVLDGWGGRVGGFGLDTTFAPVLLDGFFVDISVPDGEQFGLPAFIPLRIDEVGLALPGDLQAGDSLVDVLADLRLSVSGGLDGDEQFPITATVDDLVVDLGRLADFDPLAPIDLDTFPITNLSGLAFEIDPPLDLGAGRISGSLRFGTIDVAGEEVLYGRIAGLLSTPVFDAGADVVISEFGPVLLRVTAPLGVPLGPTGLVLTSVTGAAAFGDVSVPTPREGHPEDLLGELIDLPTDATIDEDAIRAQIAPAVQLGQYTWDTGLAIALEGDLTHVAAVGTMSGHVTLAVNLSEGAGAQLIGLGEVEVFGIPLAEGVDVSGSVALAGFMFDFGDPLAPQIDLAYESPTPGSPLALLFPVRTTAVAQLRTDGIITGVAAGLDTFVDELGGQTLAHIAARLDADRGNPLARLVLDANGNGTVSAAEGAVTITGSLLADRITTLLANPATLPATIAPLIAAVSSEVASLTSAEAAALAAQFFDVVGDAGRAALLAAGAEFDPSFTFGGELQPLVLGLPLGDPDSSVTVGIDRTSMRFELTTSMIENLKSSVGLMTGTGPFAEQLITLATLGASDELTFGVQVPVPDLTGIILGGGLLPTFDPSDPGQNWSITVTGAFTQFGLRTEVSGFLTSPGNAAFVDSRIERRWLSDGTEPPDPDRIQFTRPVDYDNLIQYGGLVLDGRLEVPRLLTDPVGVTQDLPPLPDDPLAMLGWFDDFGAAVTQTETPARLTIFVPGIGAVIDAPAAQKNAALEAWADAIAVTGVFEGTRQDAQSDPVARLLSLPIGEGRLLATSAGLEVSAEVPLAGLSGTFVLRVDDRDGIPVPAGGLELDMTSQQLDEALTGLGLPDVFDVAGVDASAGLRAFTPGFDPGSTDLLRRRGGIALRARLDADGFVDGALAEVIVDPIGTGAGPDFVATAHVDQIGPFAGVVVTDADLTIRKAGIAVTVSVEGTATVLGSQWTVSGTLNPDLTGQLVLEGAGGAAPSLGEFAFTEFGLTLSLARSGGALVGSFGVGGTVRLPTWLSGRVGRTTASAAGCIATDGASEFRVAIGSINLDPRGSARLTGTGAPMPLDPNAPCTLPGNALGLTDDDARFVLRTSGGVTTVFVDGAVSITGASLPLLSASGSLATDGRGSIAVTFSTAGLDLSGFRLRGGATLQLDGSSFRLDVDGRMSIPTLLTDAHVTGQITSSGINSLTIDTSGLVSPIVTVDSSSAALTRNTATGLYTVTGSAIVRIPGLTAGSNNVPTVTVSGAITTAGDFSMHIAGTSFRLAGVPVSGSLDMVKAGTTLSVAIDATFSLWAASLNLDGSVALSPAGMSGDLTLSMPNGVRFGGFAVGGTLRMAFAISGVTNTASITLTNGTITVPGIGTLNASAAVSTDGTGFIAASTPGGLRIGGSSSPFFGVGTFRLAFSGGVVSFAASNAGFEYRDGSAVVFSVIVPNFAIASNGSISVNTNGFTIGQTSALRLVVPPASITANASGALLKINVPPAQLFIPGMATGSSSLPAISTPAFSINTGSFSYTLLNAQQISLGLLKLNGKLVFERPNGGAFRLAIQSNSSGPANINLGELGRVEFPAFFIDSSGNFDVTATTNRIGTTNPVFEIRDASFRFRRVSNVTSLAVTGGTLRLPSLSQPIDLPDLNITTADTFAHNFTVPAIDLGPFFRSQSAQFRLQIGFTEASFELRDISGNDPSVTAFAGSTSMTLRDFRVTSNGAFSGEVTGRLALFGHRISQASFSISLDGGVLRLSLPASENETLNVGFITIGVSGFARSNGTFSFTGSSSTSGSIPFTGPSWNGSASITVATTGISGTFNGNVSFAGLSGSATASVSSTGRASGTLRVDLNGDGSTAGFNTCFVVCVFTRESAGFAFDLSSDPASADTTAPSMAQPPNVSVTTSQTTGSIPVYYQQPTASDTRDGTLNPVCTPGSGTLFAVGAATTVTCRARDAAGNLRERTFTVTVTVGVALVTLSQNVVSTSVGGFAPGSVSMAAIFSDPVALATATAGADGRVAYTIEIPRDLPPGEHHIVVTGVAPDGSQRLWMVPVTIGAEGQLTSVTAQVQPTPPAAPAPNLPATGTTPVTPLRVAAMLLTLGFITLAAGRRRASVSSR
jgi:hypothetical protein